MFKSKAKRGPTSDTVDGQVAVGQAFVELDGDALAQAGKAAASKGAKEGKKKLGYLKRMAMNKVDEKSGLVAALDETEVARREDGMGPIMDALKDAKAHCVNIKRAVEETSKTLVPEAESFKELAGVCPCEARNLVCQIFGACSGIARMHSSELLAQVAKPVIDEITAIDAAREAKEDYYEQRQNHDRRLAQLQQLQAKKETVEPAKLAEHDEVESDAKTKFQLAKNDYQRAEQTFTNFTHQALHHKSCTDVRVMKAMVAASKSDCDGIMQSFAPAKAELDKSRVQGAAMAKSFNEKLACILDPASVLSASIADELRGGPPLPLDMDEAVTEGSPLALAAESVQPAPAETAEVDVESDDGPGCPPPARLPPVPLSAPPPIPDAAPPPVPAAAPFGGDGRGLMQSVEFDIPKGAKGFGFSTDEIGGSSTRCCCLPCTVRCV